MKYIKPSIKVCDYISRNSLMIIIGEGSTDIALGKGAPSRSADGVEEVESNVWDD